MLSLDCVKWIGQKYPAQLPIQGNMCKPNNYNINKVA